jgi:hypothetical protein
MSIENSAPPRERPGFKVVCSNCGSLSIKVADRVHATDNTPVECARCGAIRGTLGGLRDLALRSGDIFEFQSKEKAQSCSTK